MQLDKSKSRVKKTRPNASLICHVFTNNLSRTTLAPYFVKALICILNRRKLEINHVAKTNHTRCLSTNRTLHLKAYACKTFEQG